MMRRSHPDHTDASFIRKGPSLNKLTTIATLSLIGLVGSPALAQTQRDRAEQVGHRIIEEFPNTRMAEEVRGMIDTIRERARSISR